MLVVRPHSARPRRDEEPPDVYEVGGAKRLPAALRPERLLCLAPRAAVDDRRMSVPDAIALALVGRIREDYPHALPAPASSPLRRRDPLLVQTARDLPR